MAILVGVKVVLRASWRLYGEVGVKVVLRASWRLYGEVGVKVRVVPV